MIIPLLFMFEMQHLPVLYVQAHLKESAEFPAKCPMCGGELTL